MDRVRFGAFACALLLPAALQASGSPELVATTFAPAGDLKAGEDIVLLWTGLSKIASESATVSFAVRRPGEDDFAPVEQIPQGKVREAQGLQEVFGWSPDAGPGRYMVAASVKCSRPLGNSWAKSDVVLFDVGKDGTVSLAPDEVLTARQLMESERPGAAAMSRGLQFGRGTLPSIPRAARASGSKSTGSFTIKGRVRYTDRPYTDGAFGSSAPVPLRRSFIWIWDDEPGLDDDFLAEVLTDNNGYFEASIPDNVDGPGEKGRDIYLEIYAENAATYVIDYGGNYYYYKTVPKSDWPGGTMDLGTTTISLPLSGPFHISDTLLKGYDYAKARGNSPPKVKVHWAANSSEGSTYSRATSTMKILGKFSDPDEFDDDVILHEYGHFLHHKLSYNKSQGGDHTWTGQISPQLAWAEGWATFFGGIVRNHRIYVDHSAASFSTDSREIPGVGKPGHDNEGAVCGTLWDIWDSSSDSPDSLSGGIAKIWPIFDHDFDASKACTLEDYYNGYKKRGFADREKVDDIMEQFGIVFDHTPRVTYPSASGIVWAHGSSQTIKWKGYNTPTVFVKIDKGASNVSNNADINNGGSVTYKIPEFFGEGNDYKVRVVSDDGLATDSSNSSFAVVSAEEYLSVGDPANESEISSSSDQDWYRFIVTFASTITIRTASGDSPALTDSVLTLYGPNTKNVQLAENDDAPGTTMSRIVKTLSAGTYYLKVRGYGASDTGNYTIRVTNP